MLIYQVSGLNFKLYHSLVSEHLFTIQTLLLSGTTSAEPVPEEDEDAAELEEEEMESVLVSEREFNFLDFIKR